MKQCETVTRQSLLEASEFCRNSDEQKLDRVCLTLSGGSGYKSTSDLIEDIYGSNIFEDYPAVKDIELT